MQRGIAYVCLVFFVALFLIASPIYYLGIVRPIQSPIPLWPLLQVVTLAGIAGVVLAQFLYFCGIIQIKRLRFRVPAGVFLGLLIFSGIFYLEHVMTTIQASRAIREPDVFSEVNGHCGVYSGRGVARWIQLSWNPTVQNKVESFLFSNQCRIRHFLDLRHRQQLPCNAGNDSVACLMEWMQRFAKKGYWNHSTRQMFFDEFKVNTAQDAENDPDQKWIQYANQDHELEAARPGLIQQAGIQEEFNDLQNYLKLDDEFKNLTMTKQVFDSANQHCDHEGRSPSPQETKFKENNKEIGLQIEKLPELEETLKGLRSKISYSPSL